MITDFHTFCAAVFAQPTLGILGRAQQYIDPGAGSLVWQMVVGAILIVGLSYRRIVAVFKRLIKRDSHETPGTADAPDEQ